MTILPVMIVGAGPVGLALGLELSWRGISCCVIEQGDGTVGQPRMDLVGIRTMEFCRRWGITERVENAGYPRDYPQDIAYVTSVTGFEIGRDIRPPMAAERAPPFSPAKRERCPQNFFDPVLLSSLRAYPQADVRLRTRLTGFKVADDHVAVDIEDTTTGHRQVLKTRYLVGCDGASSHVRESLGIGMEGSDVLTNSVNILLRFPGMTALSGKPPLYRYVLIDQEGLWATLVAINGRDVWRLQIIRGPDGRDLPSDYAPKMIRRALGTDVVVEVLSVVPWRRRELVAREYRRGRIFLCGDSAHQMSPTGGFGMNTGIGEAVDLGWKLEATLRGWAGPALLDSYEAERRPIAARNMTEASGNLRRMLELKAPSALLDTGPAGMQARKAMGEAVAATMAREWNAIGIHIGYRYEPSPICISDGTDIPDEGVTGYRQTARPGGRAPHVWLSDGRSTLDLFGRGFVLICLSQTVTGDKLRQAFARAGMPLAVHRIADPSVQTTYEAPLVLVRPDGHVAWRGWSEPDDPDRIATVLRGAG